MSKTVVTYAFIGGELDRPFYARTDLQKYPLGVALARNFTIDFRGGLKSRPGFEHVSAFFASARLFQFPTGDFTEPAIVLVAEGKLYLMIADEFLTDAPLAITNDTGAVLTLADASSVAVGDLLYTDQTPFLRRITNKAGNVITTETAGNFSIPAAGNTSARRVRSWNNPYGPVCLTQLQAVFNKNRLRITCNTRPPHELVFDTDFTFGPELFGPTISPPTGLSVSTFSLTGTAGEKTKNAATGNALGVYAVSSIDADGNESIVGYPKLSNNLFNFLDTAGLAELSWTPVTGARSYKVYRGIITEGELDISNRLGFVGEVRTPAFTDNNVVPDYTLTYRTDFNPFANGAVLRLAITDGGSGYLQTEQPLVSVAGGTGFVGYAVIRDGEVVDVLIMAPGQGFTTASAVTIAAPGTGTAATAAVSEVTPASGNNPGTSTNFQQRSVYAGTPNLPLSFFASRQGAVRDFTTGEPPSAEDAFTFAIDAEEAVPIRHILRVRNGLLLMHSLGIERLIGTQGNAINANSRQLENQAEIGVGRAVPARINDDLIFATPRGSSVISMGYTFYTNSYTPNDVSVLAAHLFGPGKEPLRFEWISEPDKLLWLLRADGRLLTLTYMKEQETFAWAQHETAGQVLDIIAVRRPTRDVLYALVQRPFGTFLEKLADRELSDLENYIGSDCALRVDYDAPQATVGGLWHLEGETVSVLADGDALLGKVVSGGSITLDNPASKFIVGLPYTCEGISLPLSDPEQIREGDKTRIIGLTVSLLETRGLELGADPRAMYAMRDKGWEDWGAVTELRSDVAEVNLAAVWKRGGQIIMRQRYPLPAHILGYAARVESE